MADCATLISTGSWDNILSNFAERLSAVADKTTVVEFARLAAVGAAISNKVRSERECAGWNVVASILLSKRGLSSLPI
jgi:hypothetical protein